MLVFKLYFIFHALLFLSVCPIYASLSIWNQQDRAVIENYIKAFREIEREQSDLFSPEYQQCIREIEEAILTRGTVNEEIKLPSLSFYPIHFAALCGDITHFAFLKEHGADLNIKDSKDRTALYVALSSARRKIIKEGAHLTADKHMQIAEMLLQDDPPSQEDLSLLLPFPALLEGQVNSESLEQLDELLSLCYFSVIKKISPHKVLLDSILQSAEILLKLGAKGQKPVIHGSKEKVMYPIHAAIYLRLKDQARLLIENDCKNCHYVFGKDFSPLEDCLLQALNRKNKKLDYQIEMEVAKSLILRDHNVLKKDGGLISLFPDLLPSCL